MTQQPDTFEKIERLRKVERTTMLRDNEGAGREERSGAEECEDAAVFLSSGIRRIEEDDIERRAGGSVFRSQAQQAAKGVEPQDSCAAVNVEGIEVFLDEGGCWWMIFNKHDFGGAAAQRFDADRSRPRKEIEEMAAGDAFGENVEESLTQAIAGRAKREALEALELAAAKSSGDDAHSPVYFP